MKRRLLSLLLIVLTSCSHGQEKEEESLAYFKQMDSLLARKDFFTARDLYHSYQDKLTAFHRLRIGAVLDNVFNRIDSSAEKINRLLTGYGEDLSDSVKYSLLNIQQTNYAKLYEYDKAYQSISAMLDRYSKTARREEVADLQNTRLIWKALSGQPRQEIDISDDTRLRMTRNSAGLSLLPVTLDTLTMGFVFDTGANLSTVTETTAGKFNMRLMQGLIDVTAITGIKIKSKIAVCPLLRIGHISIRNAVFLVFPDNALAVPQIGLQINGIIGLPIIEALREIQLTREGDFIVPATNTVYPEQNMALDFLTPVIRLDGESYSFDSGADASMLYEKYYHRHRQKIDTAYQEQSLHIGGAGGHISRRGYYVRFAPTINGRPIALDSVMLFKERISRNDESPFSGNIGQDLIRKFEKMTINFESMFIKFE